MSLLINGLTPSEMGFSVESLNDWMSGPALKRSHFTLPGDFGSLKSDLTSSEPRRIRFTALMTTVTVATREAAVNYLEALFQGALELEFTDQPDTRVIAYLGNLRVAGFEPSVSFAMGDIRVTVELVAFQTVKLEKVSRITSVKYVTTSYRKVQVGSASTFGRIWLRGDGHTSITMKVYDWRRQEQGSMVLGGTLSSTEMWVIDLYRKAIYELSDAITWVRDDTILSSGDFFEFLPSWANVDRSEWPAIRITAHSGGTGNPWGWFEYRKAWRI